MTKTPGNSNTSRLPIRRLVNDAGTFPDLQDVRIWYGDPLQITVFP